MDFKTLKKNKDIMAKWKLGSKYIYGFADLKNGRGSDVTIYELVHYTASIKWEDAEDTHYEVKLILENIETKSQIIIDQDDRYGYYALLDTKRKDNIQNTYDEAIALANKLEKILDKI